MNFIAPGVCRDCVTGDYLFTPREIRAVADALGIRGDVLVASLLARAMTLDGVPHLRKTEAA